MNHRVIAFLVTSFFLSLTSLVFPGEGSAEAPVDCTQFYKAANPSADGNFCVMSAPELDYINIIEIDSTGRVWIGTDGRGLTLIENGELRNWQPETSDIREDAIRGMAVNDKYVVAGLFGCGSCGGVAIYDIAQDEWTNLFPEDSELSGGGVGGVAIDADNRVYMPTGSGDLDIWENGAWQHITTQQAEDTGPFHLMNDSSDAIFDTDGNLYVAYGGLKKFDGQTWQDIPSFPSVGVNNLAIDTHGYIWAASNSGLIVGNEAEGWKVMPPLPVPTFATPYPYSNSFQDVAIDKEGRIWVIGTRQLAVFNGQEWALISDTTDSSIWGDTLAFDDLGYLWLEKSQYLAVFTGNITLPAPTYQSLADITGTATVGESSQPFIIYTQPAVLSWFSAIGLIFICGGLLFIGIIVFYLVRTRPKPTSDL